MPSPSNSEWQPVWYLEVRAGQLCITRSCSNLAALHSASSLLHNSKTLSTNERARAHSNSLLPAGSFMTIKSNIPSTGLAYPSYPTLLFSTAHAHHSSVPIILLHIPSPLSFQRCPCYVLPCNSPVHSNARNSQEMPALAKQYHLIRMDLFFQVIRVLSCFVVTFNDQQQVQTSPSPYGPKKGEPKSK